MPPGLLHLGTKAKSLRMSLKELKAAPHFERYASLPCERPYKALKNGKQNTNSAHPPGQRAENPFTAVGLTVHSHSGKKVGLTIQASPARRRIASAQTQFKTIARTIVLTTLTVG
jgi:hypothetical protein